MDLFEFTGKLLFEDTPRLFEKMSKTIFEDMPETTERILDNVSDSIDKFLD